MNAHTDSFSQLHNTDNNLLTFKSITVNRERGANNNYYGLFFLFAFSTNVA
jgi:hypothetical protein